MAAETASSQALKPVSQLRTAADLSRKLDSLRTARQPKERDWRLNIAFYRGNQYAQWNPYLNNGRGGIQSLPIEDGEKPRYRVRIVANQIVIGVQSLASKIIKTKPIWGATPNQPGDKAVKAAEAAEELLESWYHTLDMASKYNEAVIWSFLADNGYWKVSWDPYADRSMRFLLDPQGQPVTDQALAQEYRAELEQAGIDPSQFEKVVYMGDVKLEAMSPLDIYGDDTASSAEDWKWVFCRHWMTPDRIKVRWPKAGEVKPDAVPSRPDSQLPVHGSATATDPTVKAVWFGYFLPTPEMPNGRQVAFIEDPDTILEDGKWEYPLHKLPVFQFGGIRVPGGSDNDSIVTHVRPLQKQLNRLLSQIVEYTNMVIKPRVWAPVNSLRQRLTTEPGAVYEYTPVGNHRPEIEQLPSIPPYVFEFLNDLAGRIREMFGLTEVTEGTLPPNLEAADAIDLLQEMATDRFAPTIEQNERVLARAGHFLLSLAQQYYEEPRQMQIFGLGGANKVKEFSKADIDGDISIRVEAGSSLPRSRAARRKQIEQFVSLGLIPPDRAWKYYDIADVKDLAQQFMLDEDQALREHDKIVQGVPLNPEEMQKAIQAVNQGVNPETGEPIGSPEEAQLVLLRSSLKPMLAENLSVHLEKHASLIKSMEFDSYQPDIRQRFLIHYELTLQTFWSLPQIPQHVEPPKVTLQLKGAAGPTTVAEILRRGGVPEADPQTLATEPPMETMVIDSVDKPDADAAGPGQEANHLSQAAATLIAAQAVNAEAAQKNAHKDEQHQLTVQQQTEVHSHNVRKAKAEADLAEKKAKESSFKPQPKAPASKGK